MSNFVTFAVVGAGAIGSLGAGVLADRMARTTITMAAMAISGTCAAGIGLLFGGPTLALAGLAVVWGIAIVADSAQFSASVIELSEPKWVGTMLTVQTSVGFLITLVTIHLIPMFVDALTWRCAFAPLTIGPALGIFGHGPIASPPGSRPPGREKSLIRGLLGRLPFQWIRTKKVWPMGAVEQTNLNHVPNPADVGHQCDQHSPPRFVGIMEAFHADRHNRPAYQYNEKNQAAVFGLDAAQAEIYTDKHEVHVNSDRHQDGDRHKKPTPKNAARNSPLHEKEKP